MRKDEVLVENNFEDEQDDGSEVTCDSHCGYTVAYFRTTYWQYVLRVAKCG